MKYKTIDGNTACALSSYNFTELCAVYPITPSSTMAELIEEWSNQGKTNIFDERVKVIEMQSEAGAIATTHGSLQGGLLSSTYTASQGLLLMIPSMYKIAGEMLPCVINVASRALSTHALSILGDHQDIYATRMTGFAIIVSSSVQQVMDITTIAYLSAIESSMPFLNSFDGFRTSHELQKIQVLDKEDIKNLVNYDKLNDFKNRSILSNNVTRGMAQNEDVYFQNTEARNANYLELPDIVNSYMKKVSEITSREYKPFMYYGDVNASDVIVAMGSVCETIKEVVENENKNGNKIGLIEVHLYRPFSKQYFMFVLPKTVKRIAVLDRTKEAGSSGEPLYLDVLSMFDEEHKPYIIGGRYGLSGKDTTPSHIKSVYDYLSSKGKTNFTVGIVDDVTNLSIDVNDYRIENDNIEFLIYGYGSDGMVSASKDILKIVGDNTQKYVQGYYQYDSKKSGSITRSHIRISDSEIKSTYYVDNPKLVVCTKDSYIDKYDLLYNIKDNGTFLFVTDLEIRFPKYMIDIIRKRNIKIYVIDAYALANKNGLKNKISTVVEMAIFKITNMLPYDYVLSKMKESIVDKFSKKGEDIVNSNIKCIEEVNDYLKEVSDIKELDIVSDGTNNYVFDMVSKLKGNELKVSDFVKYKDGTFINGTSKYEKRTISEVVPKWIKENCIQCNQCSVVCPHGVIRPYLLNDEEALKCDSYIDSNNYKFVIGVSNADCTGCTLCYKQCPGKNGNKALEMVTYYPNGDVYDYLEGVSKKDVSLVPLVKNSQFNRPKFEFSGACMGCGETPYLKLLTQLFGDDLVIANATGCSSIYGASFPTTPYSIPWTSSLFEDNAEYGFGIALASMKAGKTVWIVGGDGWAYDIGYGGLDHVLLSNENVNILVLDTQLYSNTGGQSSKASDKGSVSKFTSTGKVNSKKDLARIALNYPNVYVAQVSLGGNMNATFNAFVEAKNHNGPSIVIAYSTCISHGIKRGMEDTIKQERKVVEVGYLPIFRYNPLTSKLVLDYKEPDFDKFLEYLESENRFSMLKLVNKDKCDLLFNELKKDAIDRFLYYKSLSEK